MSLVGRFRLQMQIRYSVFSVFGFLSIIQPRRLPATSNLICIWMPLISTSVTVLHVVIAKFHCGYVCQKHKPWCFLSMAVASRNSCHVYNLDRSTEFGTPTHLRCYVEWSFYESCADRNVIGTGPTLPNSANTYIIQAFCE